MNFGVAFSVSIKNVTWILIGTAMKLQIVLCKVGILTILSFSIRKHRVSFDLFVSSLFYFLFFYFFFICSEFCHTLEWNSHGFTCVPHPDPPSHLPLYPLPLGIPSAPGPSICLMHQTWAGDLFHPRYYTCFDAVPLKHPTLSFSHRVEKTVL